MALNSKSFTQLVSDAATAAQGYATSALDLSVGSVLRAIFEATSATVLWLHGLILALLNATRASTSNGSDLDTWMADFNLVRLPAVSATGLVNFSRFTPSLEATVPVGTLLQTADGTQKYLVIADSAQSHFSASRSAYILPPLTAFVQVAIQAVTPGTSGNAVIGAISVIGQSLPGVDTVSNSAGLSNGTDAETDVAFRARFQDYLQSLSKATKGAVGYAIESFRDGLNYTITENQNRDGSAHLGYFFAVVDDGSGAPSDTLLAGVSNAIDLVRPLTVSFAVFGPNVLSAAVSLVLTTATGYDHAAIAVSVVAAVTNYVNTLPLGASLPLTRVAQVAYDSTPGILNVQSVLINSAPLDLIATPEQVIKTSNVGVS
jgi:phage-related baseplate assembly protein